MDFQSRRPGAFPDQQAVWGAVRRKTTIFDRIEQAQKRASQPGDKGDAYDALLDKLQEVEQERDELRASLEEAESYCQGVRDYESALRAQLAAFEEERVREKRTFQSIAEADRARMEELTAEIAGLRSEYDELQNECEKHSRLLAKRQDYDDKCTELAILEEKCSELLKERDNICQRLTELEIGAAAANSAKLAAEARELKALDELRVEREARERAQANAEEAIRTGKAAEKDAEAARAEAKKAEANAKKAETARKKAEAATEAAKAAAETSRSEADKLQEEKAEVEGQLAEAKQALSELERAAAGRAAGLNAEVQERASAEAAVRAELEVRNAELAAVQNLLKQAQADMASIQQVRKTTNEELAQEREKCGVANAEIKALQDQIQRSQDEVAALQLVKSGTDAALQSSRARADSLANTIVELEGRLAGLGNQLRDAEAELRVAKDAETAARKAQATATEAAEKAKAAAAAAEAALAARSAPVVVAQRTSVEVRTTEIVPASPRRASATFVSPMGDNDVFLEAKEGDSDDEVDLLKGARLLSPRRAAGRGGETGLEATEGDGDEEVDLLKGAQLMSPRRVSPRRGGDVAERASTQAGGGMFTPLFKRFFPGSRPQTPGPEGGAAPAARPAPATSAPVPDSPRTVIIPPQAGSADAATLPPRAPSGRASRRGKPAVAEPAKAPEAPWNKPIPAKGGPAKGAGAVAPAEPPAPAGQATRRRQPPAKQQSLEDTVVPGVSTAAAGPLAGVVGEQVQTVAAEKDVGVASISQEDAARGPARLRRKTSKPAADRIAGGSELEASAPVPEGLKADVAAAETEAARTNGPVPSGDAPKQAPKRSARGWKTEIEVADVAPAAEVVEVDAGPSDAPVAETGTAEKATEAGSDTPPAAAAHEAPTRRGARGVAQAEGDGKEKAVVGPAGKQGQRISDFQQALAVDLPAETPHDAPLPEASGTSAPPQARPPALPVAAAPSQVGAETSGVPVPPAPPSVEHAPPHKPSARSARRSRKPAAPKRISVPSDAPPSEVGVPAGTAAAAVVPGQAMVVVEQVVTTTEEVTTEVVVTQAEAPVENAATETAAPAEDAGRGPQGGRAKASGRAASRKAASGTTGGAQEEDASGKEDGDEARPVGVAAEVPVVNGNGNAVGAAEDMAAPAEAVGKKRKPTAPPEDEAPPAKRPILAGLLGLLPWTPRDSAAAAPPPSTGATTSPDAQAATQTSTVVADASPDATGPPPAAARRGRGRPSKASGASVNSKAARAVGAVAPDALPPKGRGARASAPAAPTATKARGRKASVVAAAGGDGEPQGVARRGPGRPRKTEASPEPLQAPGDVGEAAAEEKAARRGRASSVKRGRSTSVGVSEDGEKTKSKPASATKAPARKPVGTGPAARALSKGYSADTEPSAESSQSVGQRKGAAASRRGGRQAVLEPIHEEAAGVAQPEPSAPTAQLRRTLRTRASASQASENVTGSQMDGDQAVDGRNQGESQLHGTSKLEQEESDSEALPPSKRARASEPAPKRGRGRASGQRATSVSRPTAPRRNTSAADLAASARTEDAGPDAGAEPSGEPSGNGSAGARALTRKQSTVAGRVKRAHISETIEDPVSRRTIQRAGSTIGKRVHREHKLVEEAEQHPEDDQFVE